MNSYETTGYSDGGSSAFIVIFYLCFCIAYIPILIFWIWMLVDVAKRQFEHKETKLPWVLAIVFGGLITALIYYFTVKKVSAKKNVQVEVELTSNVTDTVEAEIVEEEPKKSK